jgi:hypothetical protein
MKTASKMEVKHMGKPDEIRDLPKTHIEVCQLAGNTLMRATFEPGWKWSECVKPTAKTDLCMAPHYGYCISGQMTVVMEDGTRHHIQPGDMLHIAPGHDAWVEGTEKCIMIDFTAGENYGKK